MDTSAGPSGRGFQAALSARGIAGAAGTVKLAAAVIAPLVCLLGILGGIGSFTTVRHLAVPWFGQSAWIVPAGVDVGILALLAWDLLTEYLGLPWPVLRWTAWAFITATTYLNIAAAHGDPTASIMHAAMPVLFITVIEGIRHLVRQATGLATGTRIEHIPASRWLLAPRSTMMLARRMVLWHVTSYRDGLRLEYEHLLAVSRLQQQYGRWLWRWRAPLGKRLALRLAPASAATGWYPKPVLAGPAPSDEPLNDHDQALVEAAAAILGDATSRGAQLSQAALARTLRQRGHRVPNARLRWLSATARKRLPGEQPELPGGAMTGADELNEADQFHGLAPIFTPARAAEILRSLGLDEMTECALRTRAYRKQIPFHINGHRLTFTLADLREIAEGRAYRPEPPSEAARTEPAPRRPGSARRRAPARTQVAPENAWRARRPRDA